MKNISIALVAVLAATAPLMAAPAEKTAPEPASAKPDAVDARAVALIDKSIAVYGKFKSFSQPFVMSMPIKDNKVVNRIGTFSFARPNFARSEYEIKAVDGVRNRLAISDGKTWITQSDEKTFVQEKSQGSPNREARIAMPGVTTPFFINLIDGINEFKTGYPSVQFSSLPKSDILTIESNIFEANNSLTLWFLILPLICFPA